MQAIGHLALGALAAAALLPSATPAVAQCSVFARHPCVPSFCSVFRRGPCIPEFDYPIGQDLRLTIETTSDSDRAPEQDTTGHAEADAEHKLDSIHDMFEALRNCWVP